VSGFQLMLPPFVACMILVTMLSYLGLHVIAREVIFVDLSLAQMAALGSLSALLFHVSPESSLTYVFALVTTALGAFLFALTRTAGRRGRVPQEAFIGIVYVVASAATVLVANRVPGGGEAVERTLVGSGLLWVTGAKNLQLAIAYAALGIFQFALRRRFLTISFHPEQAEALGWKIRLWDFLFYLAFGVAITLAVPIAGVLMVFSFLVVPAVIANLFTADKRHLTIISWSSGALASILGLWLSYTRDLPTGPLIVCMYGVLLIGAVVLRKLGVGDKAVTS
jgi:zinc/manganese transport system permease protein